MYKRSRFSPSRKVSPFVKCRKALDYLCPSAAEAEFEGYAEVKSYRYLKISLIEGHRLDMDSGIDNIDGKRAHRRCSVGRLLRSRT